MHTQSSPQAGQAGKERGRIASADHVVSWLLARLAADREPPWLTDERYAWAVDHLEGCITCRAETAIVASLALGDSALSPKLVALLAHAAPAPSDTDGGRAVEPAPTDEVLAAYAALVSVSGHRAAVRRYPGVAAHLLACPRCWAVIEETRELLAEEDSTSGVPSTASPSPALGPSASCWDLVNPWVRHWRTPYQIWVQRMALRITSSITSVPAAPTLAAMPAEGPAADEQGFAIALSEDTAAAMHPWVRLEVSLRARYTRRLTGQLSMRWHASQDQLGGAAAGIPWRIERRRGEEADLVVQSGITDARGLAHLSVRGFGDYALLVEAAGREWVVPLTILADPAADAHADGEAP